MLAGPRTGSGGLSRSSTMTTSSSEASASSGGGSGNGAGGCLSCGEIFNGVLNGVLNGFLRLEAELWGLVTDIWDICKLLSKMRI